MALRRRVALGATEQRACPGCGLVMPVSEWAVYQGYYHTSPECWSVYAEVLGREYNDPGLYGGVHSLTVDAYAVQHAGGSHPPRSVGIHLAGLYLVLERDVRPTSVPRIHQRLAELVERWPRFPVPSAARTPSLTIFDVALCDANEEHVRTVHEWASEVWEAWSGQHAAVERLVSRHVPLPVRFSAPGGPDGGDLAGLRD